MKWIKEGSSYKHKNTMVLLDKVKHVKREIKSDYAIVIVTKWLQIKPI